MEEARDSGGLLDAIEARTSCRKLSEAPLPAETIARLVEAMRRAPSGGNLQAWHFYVVGNPRARSRLSRAAHGQEFIARAPVVFVVCAVPERSASRYGDRGRYLYCLQDSAAAAENLLLAAEALGLGACWVGAFDEAAVIELLDIPPGRRPVALIPVGRPLERPRRTSRLPLEETVTYVD